MGDLVLVINNPIIMSGVHKDVPVVIDIEDKITALSELFTNENRIKCIFRGMKNMIGEISNMASSYHNKITNSEARKQEYESYIDLLSVCNGKAIDFAKTGVSYPVPRNISSYAYPLPYFMKYAGPYYSKLKNLSKAHSNMNLLCMGIERWERGIKYKAPKKDFNWHIMYDEDIGYSEEHFKQIEEIFLDFDKFRKKELAFIKKCKNWPMFKNELSGKITKSEARAYETNWQSVYNNYRNKCQAICPDDRELANILLILTYEKYPSKYKKFMWHMAGSGIMKNIKPVPCQLPYLDPDGPYEYLGRRYSLSELKPHDIVTKRER